MPKKLKEKNAELLTLTEKLSDELEEAQEMSTTLEEENKALKEELDALKEKKKEENLSVTPVEMTAERAKQIEERAKALINGGN